MPGQRVVREELQELAAPAGCRAFEVMDRLDAELILPLLYKGDIKGFMVLGEKGNKDPVFPERYRPPGIAGRAMRPSPSRTRSSTRRPGRQRARCGRARRSSRPWPKRPPWRIFIHQGGNFLYANRAAEVIGGYTMRRISDHGLHEPGASRLRRPGQEPGARASRRRADVPEQYEFKIVRKNGEERWV